KPRIGTDVGELWIVLAKRARCRVVLARAFADEPVRLRAVRVADGVVEVAGEDAALSIGWPPAFAYRFDAALFGRLRAAYDRGDQATLTRLWGKARRAKLGAGE
ncbi:MAG TPA: hypothetical protein VKD46_02795, partial [bacterium]|nr:hypothetical protein [bacterium]